jgi:hypothetical protein
MEMKMIKKNPKLIRVWKGMDSEQLIRYQMTSNKLQIYHESFLMALNKRSILTQCSVKRLETRVQMTSNYCSKIISLQTNTHTQTRISSHK